jgi:uncharacterized damage-inducible protein DinB
MIKELAIVQLQTAHEFFDRSTSCLTEADSGFAPQEGLYTVAQHVAHVAHTVDWLMDGAFVKDTFDLNFEEMMKKSAAVTSLAEARRWLKDAFDRAVELVSAKTEHELAKPLPEGPIMGGAPRVSVVLGIIEHTAHHRGALTVYARELGKVPEMPYGLPEPASERR